MELFSSSKTLAINISFSSLFWLLLLWQFSKRNQTPLIGNCLLNLSYFYIHTTCSNCLHPFKMMCVVTREEIRCSFSLFNMTVLWQFPVCQKSDSESTIILRQMTTKMLDAGCGQSPIGLMRWRPFWCKNKTESL